MRARVTGITSEWFRQDEQDFSGEKHKRRCLFGKDFSKPVDPVNPVG
jgi:hypothetical protein